MDAGLSDSAIDSGPSRSGSPDAHGAATTGPRITHHDTIGSTMHTARPTLSDLLCGLLTIARAGSMRADAPMVLYLQGEEDDPDLRGAVLDAFLASYMPDGSAILLDDVHVLDDLLSEVWHDARP